MEGRPQGGEEWGGGVAQRGELAEWRWEGRGCEPIRSETTRGQESETGDWVWKERRRRGGRSKERMKAQDGKHNPSRLPCLNSRCWSPRPNHSSPDAGLFPRPFRLMFTVWLPPRFIYSFCLPASLGGPVWASSNYAAASEDGLLYVSSHKSGHHLRI